MFEGQPQSEVEALMKANAEFRQLYHRHKELDKQVLDAELGVLPVDDVRLNKMKRDTSAIRLRNRCQLTGRARGYLRRFKLSRLSFREMASQGLIPGVVKASW